MLINTEKIYKEFKQFNKKDWKQVDKEMTKIIKQRKKNIVAKERKINNIISDI